MHSRIFQITTEQVERENYLNEDTLEQGDNVLIDYCAEIDDDEREENIACLVDDILPKGMFTRMGANIIRYNGGIEQWKEEIISKIRTFAADLTTDNLFQYSTHKSLKNVVTDPLGAGALFYTNEDGTQDWAESSYDFMELINNLEAGTLLYIGGVIDGYYIN